jgi:hypothetical protein
MKVEVVTPEEYVGSVIGDLNSRRGMIQGQDMRGNATIINAMVPAGEHVRLREHAALVLAGPRFVRDGIRPLRRSAEGVHGAERNQAEGAIWMRRAADAGHADAQFELARLNERGQGVDLNAAEAARLMRLAAIQGHRSARVAMVQYAFDGTGMTRDLVRAEMWALIVERHDDPVAAEGRAVLHSQLTDAQRAAASRLADQCEADARNC